MSSFFYFFIFRFFCFYFFFSFFFLFFFFFFFSSRRRHTRYIGDWSSDVCSSDLQADVFLLGSRPIPVIHQLDRAHRGMRLGERVVEDDCLLGGGTRRRHGFRSEERRVGKECRSRWSPDHEKEKAERGGVVEGGER